MQWRSAAFVRKMSCVVVLIWLMNIPIPLVSMTALKAYSPSYPKLSSEDDRSPSLNEGTYSGWAAPVSAKSTLKPTMLLNSPIVLAFETPWSSLSENGRTWNWDKVAWGSWITYVAIDLSDLENSLEVERVLTEHSYTDHPRSLRAKSMKIVTEDADRLVGLERYRACRY